MFENFLPARGQKREVPIKIADLDKISTQSYFFTLHGKDHAINPPDIKTWLELVEQNNKLWELGEKDFVSSDEFIDAYYALISKLCKTITREDIAKANQMQTASLWQMVLDMQNGFSQKKTLVNLAMQGMTKRDIGNLVRFLSQYASTLRESSQTLPENSDGLLT